MKKYLWIVGLLLLLTACGKYPHVENPDTFKNPVLVKIHLDTTDLEGVTRIMDENAIEDVNLFLYGDLSYHFYYDTPTSSLSFNVIPGIYLVYIVTNTHKDMGLLTKNSLLAYGIAVGSMNDYDNIPMTAHIQLSVGGSGVSLPSTIQVKRCAAKISYNIQVVDALTADIKLRSVQFCNLPRMIYPFDENRISATNKNDYYDGEVVSASDTKNISGACYLFENKQGVIASITDQKDKSPENAPACASYMRILAQGMTDVIEYRVYLGENNTSDFNVRRNTKHNMVLIIHGRNEIDNRTKVYDGLYFGTANSYICTSTQITFDVTPYRTSERNNYAYTGIYAGDEYRPPTAKLLWQDVPNLVRRVVLTKNTLSVTTSGAEGNAVVGLYDDAGTIVWSFHIWCMKKEAPKITYKSKENISFEMMDRHMGAISATDGDIRSYGLLYQWGRKDPFVSGRTFKSKGVDFQPIYNINNKQYTWDRYGSSPLTDTHYGKMSSTIQPVFEDCIRHPMTYNAYRSTFAKAGFWGDPITPKDDFPLQWSSGKSIYDPCPEGYRVPNKNIWGVVWNQLSITSFTDTGWFTSANAYFPKSGTYSYVTGELELAGSTSKMWACNTYAHFTTGAWTYNIYTSTVTPFYNFSSWDSTECYMACSIRCVKEF